MSNQLGTVQISQDILKKKTIGLWAIEIDAGEVPRMYGDEIMLGLLGLSEQYSPQEKYQYWYDHIDNDFRGLVSDAVTRMKFGEFTEISYLWHAEDGSVRSARAGGVRNYEYTDGIRVEGIFSFFGGEVMAQVAQNVVLDHFRGIYLADLAKDSIIVVKRSGTFSDDFELVVKQYTAFMATCIELLPIKYRSEWAGLDTIEGVRAFLKNHDNRELIFETSSEEKTLSRCTWYVVKRENGEADMICFAFSNLDDQRAKMILLNRQMAHQKVLLDYFVESFSSAYFVNLDTDVFEIIHMDQEFAEVFKDKGNREDMENFIEEHVHSDDRSLIRTVTNKDYVRARLADESNFAFTIREVFNGNEKTMRGLIVRGADTRHIAVGFMDITDEMVKEHEIQTRLEEALVAANELNANRVVIESLSEDFFCVNYVELKEHKHNDIGIYYRTSEYLKKLIPGWEKEKSFSKKMALIRDYIIYEPDREQFYQDSRRDTVIKNLKKSDVYYINSRAFVEGEIRYYQVKISAVRHEGQLVGFVAGLHSVDESVRRELAIQEKLEAALLSAEVANESKTNFLFNMSHDIRTPMNAIRGFTIMAKKYLSDEKKVSDYLTKIDISCQQLLMLINQVLEMSRIESGKIEFESKHVNIQDKFNSMVTVLAEQAKGSGLTFNYTLKDIEHYNVIADEARMSQITLNITGNAIKYTPEGGTIDYSLREIKGRKSGYATYVFTVSDNGIGMSEEFLKELFEPFSREKSSTVSHIQGTGLGMAIVKNLVDLMGGTIEVKSAPGKGTRFDITIDLKIDNEEIQTVNRVKNTALLSFAGCRVLLAEDNEMNREIAKDILEEHGFVVEEATDGDIAVDMVEKIVARDDSDYYDYILMDIQMPRMNGYEATKKIRSLLAPKEVHVPILAMTANAFEEDRKNAISAGMDDHLAKPIEVPQLFETLAKFRKKNCK